MRCWQRVCRCAAGGRAGRGTASAARASCPRPLLPPLHRQVNRANDRGWTALHAAASADQGPACMRLAAAGAALGARDANGDTPAGLARKKGLAALALMLDNQDDASGDPGAGTPLGMACAVGDTVCMQASQLAEQVRSGGRAARSSSRGCQEPHSPPPALACAPMPRGRPCCQSGLRPPCARTQVAALKQEVATSARVADPLAGEMEALMAQVGLCGGSAPAVQPARRQSPPLTLNTFTTSRHARSCRWQR